MSDLVIYCADIGSVAHRRFGWARLARTGGAIEGTRGGGGEIAELVDQLANDLALARAVALGFECPLFVPVPEDSAQLGKARVGEGNRSWSAGAGAGALATGLVEVAWILAELAERGSTADAFLDWERFTKAGRGLFLWEAFVTAEAKTATHAGDAAIAVEAFSEALPDPTLANAVHAERQLSLLGAALVWGGWATEASLLRSPCLVIKARAPAARVAATRSGPEPNPMELAT